jgi:uncharacterized protein (TIGR02391 family)
VFRKAGSNVHKWYLGVRALLREIRSKALDAKKAWSAGDEVAAQVIHGYLRKDYQRLQELWNEAVEGPLPTYLGRHIGWGMENDVDDMLRHDISELEERLDSLLAAETEKKGDEGFHHLLHPAIVGSSYELFQSGHLRDAVLNSVVAVFDLIRERTGLDLDGSGLVNRAFSLTDPYLVLSELETDSGQNDQKGFIQLFSGSYQGIRNSKAHSLNHDLTESKASQYLVHASLLARRVSEGQVVKTEPRKANSAKPKSRKPSRS